MGVKNRERERKETLRDFGGEKETNQSLRRSL